MSEQDRQQRNARFRPWVQFLGWFLAAEFLANAILVATVSVVGWEGFVHDHRVVIQIAVLVIALAVALSQALTGSFARAIDRRATAVGEIAERNARLATQVSHLEHLLRDTQAEVVTANARWEAEQVRAASDVTTLNRLASTLRAVIAAAQVERHGGRLRQCHRNGRGEIICTLPLGRAHGLAEGIRFTLVDGREQRPLGEFRVTGAAETFAACTLLDGSGWLLAADRYADDALPPHSLAFPLPTAAREMDAQAAEQMLRLLAALASGDDRSAAQSAERTPQEVAR